MKYCYQIVKKGEKHPVFTCATPVDNSELATELGHEQRRLLKLSMVFYDVKVEPIAETVEEEDMLNGHPYPGHETYDPVSDERFD